MHISLFLTIWVFNLLSNMARIKAMALMAGSIWFISFLKFQPHGRGTSQSHVFCFLRSMPPPRSVLKAIHKHHLSVFWQSLLKVLQRFCSLSWDRKPLLNEMHLPLANRAHLRKCCYQLIVFNFILFCLELLPKISPALYGCSCPHVGHHSVDSGFLSHQVPQPFSSKEVYIIYKLIGLLAQASY